MSDKNANLLLSVTRDDCEWRYQVGRGNGGQKKQKTSSAVICSHRPSGAQGYAEDTRSQLTNRQLAFVRMIETREFQSWLKTETLRRLGILDEIEARVDKAMHEQNLIIEVSRNGKWQPIENNEILKNT